MIKGKGAQSNPSNPFLKQTVDHFFEEGIDVNNKTERPNTQVFEDHPKSILSKNNSEDIPFEYSINPYQGCEHGCIYCYARTSHTYWGYSIGLDFESKIVVKKNVAKMFESNILAKNWKVQPVMLSGNTDCYQPLEKDYKLTRSLLEVAVKYRHPVSIITKNALILRDLDLLADLAKDNLISVAISITSLDESLRRGLEPRTSSYAKRFEAVVALTQAGVPVMVMLAPIIPSFNDHEIPNLAKLAADAGAKDISYTVVRLNGQIGELFEQWILQAYPERASKVLNQIKAMHGGELNDSTWKKRMTGEGQYAQMIRSLYVSSRTRYFTGKKIPPLNCSAFRKGGNYSLF